MTDRPISTNIFDLSEKVAIVTGSTRGIGLAIVEQFCHAGAACVISGEEEAEVNDTVKKLSDAGHKATGLACDVADRQALASLVDVAVERFGRLDILVCNAGITGKAGSMLDVEETDYARVFDVNLHSMVTLAGLAIPHVEAQGGGSIILLSSIAAMRGNAAINAYALAKAGVTQLARNLAVQFGASNIRVNSISPGLINTGFSAPLIEDKDFMRRRMQMTPLRRPGTAYEIAGCAHFLASAAGAFVTGHNLVVDGGTTITDGS